MGVGNIYRFVLIWFLKEDKHKHKHIPMLLECVESIHFNILSTRICVTACDTRFHEQGRMSVGGAVV